MRGWLAGPAVAAHTAPCRLRVEGTLGARRAPASGILPGRALAVFVLEVLIAPWEVALKLGWAMLKRRA
eukprot:9604531-Lingulodinium_polyedra.AAC.1